MTRNEFIKEVLPLSDKVFRLSFRLLNDREMAKDMVQTIYLKLWDRRDEISRVNNAEAFIITMTKNACLDRIKLQKNNTEISRYDVAVEPEYERTEYVQIIKRIITTLPDLQKKIIELRDIEGFSFEEISAILNLPLNNIRVSLSIARKKVRDELIKTYNYGIRKD
jgi:RNA polymerase sigma-70 factor (ECF subfamily)